MRDDAVHSATTTSVPTVTVLPPHDTLSQRDFLARFGPALTERVATACPPVYRGPADAPWAPLALLKRKPLGAQGLIAQAGACAIRGLREHGRAGQPTYRSPRKRRRGLGLVAEMATGKSLLSLAILGLADEDVTRRKAPVDQRPQKAQFFPAAVLCPPIVAAKWVREAANTLPTARPVVIRQLRTRAEVAAFRQFDPAFSGKHLSAIGCAERVVQRIRLELAVWRRQRDTALRERRTPPRKPCHIAILSTSTAKLGPAWTPVYVLRALRDRAGGAEDTADGHAATAEQPGGTGYDGRGGSKEKIRLLRDPATGDPYVVPCCPRCFAPLKDEARAARAERERGKRQNGGSHANTMRAANGTGRMDAKHDVDDDDGELDAYLREAELLGTSGCPRAKRTCSSCGEPLWQVVPDNARWEATSPPLPGVSTGIGLQKRRTVRPLPLPDRTVHPPCITSTLERRYPLADYLRKRHRGLFRSLICDEAHQFKGAGTAQGFAAASLVDACDPGGTTLFLTGTLYSGYASDLYPMLWRLLPELRTTFGYGDLKRWVDLYGVRQKVFKVREGRAGRREDGAVSKRREDKPLVKELPGISPLVLRHLLDSCLFLELADVAPGLPPYSEEVVVVPLSEPLGSVYAAFERESTAALKEMLAHEDHSGLAAWFQGLMIQPNLPWRGFTTISSHGDVLGQAEPLPEGQVYPKEQALLDLARRERTEGRRILVYAEHTGAYDLLPRLKSLLETDDAAWREQWARQAQQPQPIQQAERPLECDEASSGEAEQPDVERVMPKPPAQRVRVALLRSATVASSEREEWLRRTVEQGCDVLICHSGLVEVGLDLLDFPTIVCYETIFSTCRARQATRRSYRPGQTLPVKVVQVVYDKTMEARGLQLIASKIKSSLMVEGKLPGEGLAAFGQSSDDQGNLLLELARSVLADEEGAARDVAGSLEATFRDLAATEREQDGYIGEVELPTGMAVEDLDEVEDGAAVSSGDANEYRRIPDIANVPTKTGSLTPAQPDALSLMAAFALQESCEQESSTDQSHSVSDSPPSFTATHRAPAGDQWARWRELQRQLSSTRRRARSPSKSGAGTMNGPEGLWSADTTPRFPQESQQSPASHSDGERSGQPVQATLWDIA